MPRSPKKNPEQLYWYKDALIYELHIKAFRDGNGDGIGDFQGLMEKLDYLQDLGITAIWLLPFYPSPLKDDGYDIADYYRVNPAYGDIRQFKKFLAEAHKRNLKVITELVINHTSDQHKWFQRARHAPKGSPERNFYVWTDNPEQYKDVRIIFQDYETSNWTWDPVAGQYYWHRFFHHQPDLNYDNPAVQEEVFKILDYWCDMGVDGFRLDAVPYLFEREGTNGENLPETHDFLKKLRKHTDLHYPGTLLLAEANMWPEDSAAYFGKGDECHMNYHFPVMPRMFMALQMEDRHPITDIFEQTPEIPDKCQWAIFLRNHDELTLEMVTDEERDYMYKVYVKDPKARINLGIRHRLAPLMGNDRKKIELLHCLLFSFPGTPVIYYGDELGMGDNVYLGDRDGVRTPMQWTAAMNAGFSEANPQKLYLPLIIDPLYHYEMVNVDMQQRNTASVLWWMKRMIHTRKKYKAFGWGDMKFIAVDNAKALVFTRSYEDETILVIANLSRFAQPVEVDLDAYKGAVPVEVFSKNHFPVISGEQPYLFTLSAYECLWFELVKEHTPVTDQLAEPLQADTWEDMLSPVMLEALENDVLPDYLMKVRWFGGKGRAVQGLRISDTAFIPMEKSSALLLLVEVSYKSGLPDTYQLHLGFARGSAADKVKNTYPQAFICRLQLGDTTGIVYDALFGPDLPKAIVSRMAAHQKIHPGNSTISFTGNRQLKQYLAGKHSFKAKVLSAEQSNTSVNIDNRFFLKIYRKVDKAMNPDLELTRFLTEHAGFKHIPAYVGAVEWRDAKDTMVLAMMQEMVDNSSDTWNYMLERLNRYYEHILSEDHLPPAKLAVKGTLTDPLAYEEIPEQMKALLDGVVAEQVRLLGVRTAEMHLALASGTDLADFKPEAFSLHYQRSLYASFRSLVQRTFQSQSRNINQLPEGLKQDAAAILDRRTEVLDLMRKIYERKIDTVKIRIHGDYHLGQILSTGKDFVILDFEGEPARSYSERRLKRSPLRDVAGMIRSLHYAAYASIFLDTQTRKKDIERLIPFAELWYHYMSGFFLRAYLERVAGTTFIPENKDDFRLLLQVFLLEKAIYELNYELNNRPDWIMIPLQGIQAVLKEYLPVA